MCCIPTTVSKISSDRGHPPTPGQFPPDERGPIPQFKRWRFNTLFPSFKCVPKMKLGLLDRRKSASLEACMRPCDLMCMAQKLCLPAI
jgi:hypothetical protein